MRNFPQLWQVDLGTRARQSHATTLVTCTSVRVCEKNPTKQQIYLFNLLGLVFFSKLTISLCVFSSSVTARQLTQEVMGHLDLQSDPLWEHIWAVCECMSHTQKQFYEVVSNLTG